MLKDPPPHKPEPLGVAVCSLPGACTSQSSGHGGGQPGGRWEGAVVLSSLPGVGGLGSVVALQGLPSLLSLSLQPQMARPVRRRPPASLTTHLGPQAEGALARPSTATPGVVWENRRQAPGLTDGAWRATAGVEDRVRRDLRGRQGWPGARRESWG